MLYATAITTAPRREPTLVRTLTSLRAAGFDPTVYAEPGSPVPADVPAVHRPKTLGTFGNWRQTLADALAFNAGVILLAQDDILVARCARSVLDAILWPSARAGVVSLYCPSHFATGAGLQRIDSTRFWGACALVIRPDVAAAMLDHPVCRNWTSERKVDLFVARMMPILGRELWAFTPSLCQHIGETSTNPANRSGAHGRRAAADFVGEDVSLDQYRAMAMSMQRRSN